MAAVGDVPLRTVCIGSWPKPDWLFQGVPSHSGNMKGAQSGWKAEGDVLHELQDKATKWCVSEQGESDLEVVSDGEMRRDNYIWYHVQKAMRGVDFTTKTQKPQRAGNETVNAPTITAKVELNRENLGFLVKDWQFAMSALREGNVNSNATVMVSMPGPMTCIDSLCCTKNYSDKAFYASEEECADDIAEVLNAEIKELVNAGCTYIGIDEPVFVRYPEKVKAWGIRTLDKCFEGVDLSSTFTQCHICCSYPTCPKKADLMKYAVIAPDLNRSEAIKSYSIEHAHRGLDLNAVLTPLCCGPNKKAVTLGLCDIGKERVESVEEIEWKVEQAMLFVPPEQILLAPDCGCVLLSPETAKAKMKNLCSAAYNLRQRHGLVCSGINGKKRQRDAAAEQTAPAKKP